VAGFTFRGGRVDREFERLYRQHVTEVFRYALAVLTNQADAEDVTQTTFLNAYRAFEKGQKPEQPLNWLITIAHNVCRQRFRSRARRPSEVELNGDLIAAPAEDADGRFRREDVLRALSQLTFNQRSALAMRELEGRSYKEIADMLGITVAAVETLIFRARRVFREQLEGSLTCSEAERAISRELDGMPAAGDKAALRAHLRSCSACASLARRFRAQRSALKGIWIFPLPSSLASFSGGGSGLAGGVTFAGGVGVKAAAVAASALLAGGVGTGIALHEGASSAQAADRPAVASAPVARMQLVANVIRSPEARRAVVPVAARKAPVHLLPSVHPARPHRAAVVPRASGPADPRPAAQPTPTQSPAAPAPTVVAEASHETASPAPTEDRARGHTRKKSESTPAQPPGRSQQAGKHDPAPAGQSETKKPKKDHPAHGNGNAAASPAASPATQERDSSASTQEQGPPRDASSGEDHGKPVDTPGGPPEDRGSSGDPKDKDKKK
jgi:RNA polymerase sigma factor (sigma-70 family)